MNEAQDHATALTRNLARDVDRHFEDLVTAYQRPLFAFAYRMSNSSQDAEEVVQDVFTRAYRALRTYEPDRIRSLALQAWLYRICLNLLRNRVRRARLRTSELNGDIGLGRGETTDPVADTYERREHGDEMRVLLGKLPLRYRGAVVLRYVNDLTYAEMSTVLRQPEGTVKSNVHRGLGLLRAEMMSQKGDTQ